MCKVALVFPESFAYLAKEVKDELERRGCSVIAVSSENPIDDHTKRSLLEAVDIYVTGGIEKISRTDIKSTKSLRLIQRFGAGYENIDIQEASRRGIYVANIPGVNADSVADLTMGLILSLMRHIVKADTSLRAGIWRFWIGHELTGKVLGIAGLGAIGKAVALRAQAHGMKIIAYDARPDLKFADSHKIKWVPKSQLLEKADIITLHMPLNIGTRNFISKQDLGRMKPTAYLVNTSRGGLVNQTALIEALREGKISGAALDVFSEEPVPTSEEILELDNVVLTPHIGGSTFEALARLAKITVDNCLRMKQGELPMYIVNKVI